MFMSHTLSLFKVIKLLEAMNLIVNGRSTGQDVCLKGCTCVSQLSLQGPSIFQPICRCRSLRAMPSKPTNLLLLTQQPMPMPKILWRCLPSTYSPHPMFNSIRTNPVRSPYFYKNVRVKMISQSNSWTQMEMGNSRLHRNNGDGSCS